MKRYIYTVSVFLALAVFSSPEALAASPDAQDFMQVTNDKTTDKVEVGALSKDGNLIALYGKSNGGAIQQFSLSDISSSSGALIYETQGYKVLFLQGTFDARTQEGDFTMRYLSNGLFGSYKSCSFTLRRDAQGWYVENAYTHVKPVENVFVKTSSLGVSTIVGLCPGT